MPTADELIGTWRVTGFREWREGGVESRPLGDTPVGYAVFDSAGHIFVQLGKNPKECASAKAAADLCMAYFGRFEVRAETLSLGIESGNESHDVATTQIRTITRNGDDLTIGTPGQIIASLRRVAETRPSVLTGAWRVQSFTRFAKDGAPSEPLGTPPGGYAVFDSTGHVYVQLGKAASSASPEEVAKSLMFFFGPYSAAGDAVSVAVETSNIPDYIGSTQTRTFSMDGDTLKIGTPGGYQAVCRREP